MRKDELMEALSMWPILGYNWFDLVKPQLLACGNVTEYIDRRKPEKRSMVEGYPVGFT